MAATLDFALEWAARGFRVFPIEVGGTKPAVKNFSEVATSDPDAIRKMWGMKRYNVGVATDDLTVVDVDVKKGKKGLDSLAKLPLDMLETLVVRTPSGGYHIYYKASRQTANSQGRLGLGIDTRGHHGYVIAPGSATRAGVYSIENDSPVGALPEEVLAFLPPPGERDRGSADVTPDDDTALALAEAYLASDEGAVEGQNGDAHTYAVACRLRDLGVSDVTAFDLMSGDWNSRCSPPWPLDELERKVLNAFQYAQSPAGREHPSNEFEGVTMPAIAPPQDGGRRWIRHGEPWQDEARWLFYGILPATGVAILTGPPGGGKTFLAGHIAEKLATGEALFGEAPDDVGGTIFLAAEGQGSIGARLSVLGKGRPYALPISATPVAVLGDRTRWEKLRGDIKEECKRVKDTFDCPVRMIVLDTLSASGLLPDENDNGECALAMAKLASLSAEFGVLLLLIHHPPKSGTGLRGGSALLGSTDYLLEIEREPNRHVRKLWLNKARDAEAPRALGGFGLQTVVIGIDARDRDITTCMIEASTGTAYTEKRPSHFDIYMDCFSWARVSASAGPADPVAVSLLKRAFLERDPGSTKTATAKAFEACHQFAYNNGWIEIVETDAFLEPFVKERTFDVGA